MTRPGLPTSQGSSPFPAIRRPASAPREGQIDAYDAGWNAREKGLSRETVRVLSPSKFAREWALLAWDTADLMAMDA